MKNSRIGIGALAFATMGIFAFSNLSTSSIKGSVSPGEGAMAVWAISGKDTLKAPIANGNFDISIDKTGTYTVIVDAVPPYKDAVRDGIVVSEGQPADIGVIVLEK